MILKMTNPWVHIVTPTNTVLASPRGLIALLENNYMENRSIKIPLALRKYMGNKEIIEINKETSNY